MHGDPLVRIGRMVNNEQINTLYIHNAVDAHHTPPLAGVLRDGPLDRKNGGIECFAYCHVGTVNTRLKSYVLHFIHSGAFECVWEEVVIG